MTSSNTASCGQDSFPVALSSFDSVRGGGPSYFRLPSFNPHNSSNVTLPKVDLSKLLVSRDATSVCGGQGSDECTLRPNVEASMPEIMLLQSEMMAKDNPLDEGEIGGRLILSRDSIDSFQAEWDGGLSTISSTRPSSAQKLTDFQSMTALPRHYKVDVTQQRGSSPCLESVLDMSENARASAAQGPAPLTLSSPTALLSSAPEWQSQFYRTKLCPFFVREFADPQTAAAWGPNVGWAGGDCVNGDSCRFAHSTAELRPLPDLRKTKLCSSYTKKVACKNSKCPFAHSPKELRTSSSIFYKVTLCNFYKNGKCWNGANCRFAHGSEELRNAAASGAQSVNSENHSAYDADTSRTVGSMEIAVPLAQCRRSKGSKCDVPGLLPKPGGTRATVPPPPPPPSDSISSTYPRRCSVSSLSTVDTSGWKPFGPMPDTTHLRFNADLLPTCTGMLPTTNSVPTNPITGETATAWPSEHSFSDPPGFSPLQTTGDQPTDTDLLHALLLAVKSVSKADTLPSSFDDQGGSWTSMLTQPDLKLEELFPTPTTIPLMCAHPKYTPDLTCNARSCALCSTASPQILADVIPTDAPISDPISPSEVHPTSAPPSQAQENSQMFPLACDGDDFACLQVLLKIVNGQLVS